jgi:restriction system protein
MSVAEITRQRTGELLRKLFEILERSPDGLWAKDAIERLEKGVTLTPYEAGNYESGGRRFDKIVRFATVDCVKAGWMQKTKGTWFLTDAGRAAYKTISDPATFYGEASRLYRKWKDSQPTAAAGSEDDEEEPLSKTASITFERAEEQPWSEIESYLRYMPPYEFQELVAARPRAMGYHISWVAPPGKDGGTDVIALVDPLGSRPPRIKVQVKREQTAIAVNVVRSFMAVLGGDDIGLFVSVSGFTKDSETEALTQEKRRVTLIDLKRLFDLSVEYYPKLTDEARQRLPLRPIWFLAPDQ